MGKKHKYGVVLDAGSSGTRVYVYEYKRADYVKEHGDADEMGRLPKVKTKKSWRLKKRPGISTFASKPERVGPDHLEELTTFAKDKVPRDEWASTPIFLLATAGMRLLPEYQQRDVLKEVCAHFRKSTEFLLPDCAAHIQVIPGETEGLYGWIAANYLLAGFDAPAEHDHGKGHHTYGFLDMGGASAQIAFAPNATEARKHANDLKLLRLRTVGGEPLEYGVFVTTWLRFGVNEARRRFVDNLLTAYSGASEIPDPCLPVGLLVTPEGEEIEPSVSPTTGKQPHLIGTGKFTECLSSTFPLLEKNKACADPPCLLSGVHTPALDWDVNHFVGVSEYWHTTHEIFAMAHKDKAYDLQTYQKQVITFCSRDWVSIEADVEREKWGHKVDEKTVEEVCFKASWIINVLHDGIGIPRFGLEQGGEDVRPGKNKTEKVLDQARKSGFLDPFQAVDEIDGKEVSWTMGKMVLYASSQMPSADDEVRNSTAVGFGSNVPGSKALPLDWQYPSGGQYVSVPKPVEGSVDSSGEDWHDRILASSYSRRIPGIIIFLVILALAVYLLCGRERRLSLWHRFRGQRSSGKRRRPGGILSGKLFGRNTEPSYERVMEDAADTTDFELTDVPDDQRNSDSSTASTDTPRTGRTSGWATPAATRGLSPDISRASPKHKAGYFDTSSTSSSAGGSNGLGITPFAREGLIVRNESRELLTAGKELLPPPPRSNFDRNGRTGSPRRSPLLTPFKESVD